MLWITIDKESKTPMIRQIYSRIRERILSGKLLPSARLPSSRELAGQLLVSRNVVLEAYDLLYAEGFLESKRGAGTFVAAGTAFTISKQIQAPTVDKVTMGYDFQDGIINFRAGTPNLKMFPKKLWLKMLKNVFNGSTHEVLAYGHPEGRLELREAICDYVVRQREVICHPDQIVITAGTTQAIGIACHLLLHERKDVVLENPITNDIQLITQAQGAMLHPISVDNEGMQTDTLPQQLNPAFIYVTPSHQFPIGGTLPIQRRIDLLNFARQKNCYILEDDYDSEFRFDGPPLSSLHGLCPDRVIYIGTFSKTLCPAIRIGYMILPPELINRGRNRKWHSDLHNEVCSQLALAGFIREGFYLRHVVRMRKHYKVIRRAVTEALSDHFGDDVQILGSATGLHLTIQFKESFFSSSFFDKVEKAGVRVYPVADHAVGLNEHRDKILIGYGNLTVDEAWSGIEILSRIFYARRKQGRCHEKTIFPTEKVLTPPTDSAKKVSS